MSCTGKCYRIKSKKDSKKDKWKEESMDEEVEAGALGTGSSRSPNDTASTEAEDNTPKVVVEVQEVSDFITNLPGCSNYAKDFINHEIDGQALMLLKEDHLMTAMAMKLRPALQIVEKMYDMRVDKEPSK